MRGTSELAFRLADGLGRPWWDDDISERLCMSQSPFGLLTDWDYGVELEFGQPDTSSQSPFGLLTDWDSVGGRPPEPGSPCPVSIAFRLADGLGQGGPLRPLPRYVSIAFQLADGLGPKGDSAMPLLSIRSQSPFGLLTDWDRKEAMGRRVPGRLVSIAFRLADGLGRSPRYGDRPRRGRVSIAFRLADGLGPGGFEFAQAILAVKSQSPFGLLTDWDFTMAGPFAMVYSSQSPFGLLTDWDKNDGAHQTAPGGSLNRLSAC